MWFQFVSFCLHPSISFSRVNLRPIYGLLMNYTCFSVCWLQNILSNPSAQFSCSHSLAERSSKRIVIKIPSSCGLFWVNFQQNSLMCAKWLRTAGFVGIPERNIFEKVENLNTRFVQTETDTRLFICCIVWLIRLLFIYNVLFVFIAESGNVRKYLRLLWGGSDIIWQHRQQKKRRWLACQQQVKSCAICVWTFWVKTLWNQKLIWWRRLWRFAVKFSDVIVGFQSSAVHWCEEEKNWRSEWKVERNSPIIRIN